MGDVGRAVNSSVLDEDVLSDDFDGEPVENGNVSLGEFELVGHGEMTNEDCGRFTGYYYGCDRVDLHNKTGLNGVNYTGKVYVKKSVFHSCNKPSCPVCYKYGWAVRQAKSIENRLKVASKRFGLPEHIIATFPPKYYHLTHEQLRKKAVEILERRGVVGGCLMFHGGRYNLRKQWYWSPHFHVLGFILGGYRCRTCKKVRETGKCGIENYDCNGFVNRNYREFEKDGCIVKVKGKRKSVFWTAYYQLGHSTIRKNSVRFHVATYFGNVSYRKMKVTEELRKSVCPICQHDLVKLRYNGSKLDFWFLICGDCFVPYEEQHELDVFFGKKKEVVWERVVSSVSHKYCSED